MYKCHDNPPKKEDLPLLQPLSHTGDPQTSYDAAERLVQSGGLNKQEALVLDTLRRHDRPEGYTTKEMAELVYYPEKNKTQKYHMCARRLPGLLNKDKVKRLIISRDGCRAWRVK